MSPSDKQYPLFEQSSFERAQDVLMLLLALASGARIGVCQNFISSEIIAALQEDRKNLFHEIQTLNPNDAEYMGQIEAYLRPWLNAYIDRVAASDDVQGYIASRYPGLVRLLEGVGSRPES